MLTLNIQLTDIKETIERKLDPRKVQRAAANALKRVVQTGRTEVSSAIRDVYNIKKRDLDKRITVSHINKYDLSATLTVSGRGNKISVGEDKGSVGIGLAYFGAKQIKGTKQLVAVKEHRRIGNLFGKGVQTFTVPQYLRRIKKGGGVSAQIFTGGNKTFLKGAFLSTMKSGHIGVMRRHSEKMMVDKKKLAIFEKSMVSLPTMFLNAKTKAFERLKARVLEQWPKEFKHALERELEK